VVLSLEVVGNSIEEVCWGDLGLVVVLETDMKGCGDGEDGWSFCKG